MQTLVFNTTLKTAKLYEGNYRDGKILFSFDNISTVKVMEGFYELMQRDEDIESGPMSRVFPVLRVGISSTNMLIER
jgi:hypothetical protein